MSTVHNHKTAIFILIFHDRRENLVQLYFTRIQYIQFNFFASLD